MESVFIAHGHQFVELLSKVKPGDHIDLQAKYFEFTMDAISEIAFSHPLNSMASANAAAAILAWLTLLSPAL